MFSLGTVIVSTYDRKICGPIVGYGMLHWPTQTDGHINPHFPVVVYLIQVAIGSSALGPAVRAIDATHCVEEKDVHQITS